MLDIITICRFLLIPVGIGSIFLVAGLTKPSKEVLYRVLRFCWVAGVLNLLVDIVQKNTGFWHYTADYLIGGYPLDLYIAVSLIIGVAVPLFYHWLHQFHPQWKMVFVLLLPLYLLLQDYLAITATGTAVISIDSPYWWISDLICVTIIALGTLLVSRIALRDRI